MSCLFADVHAPAGFTSQQGSRTCSAVTPLRAHRRSHPRQRVARSGQAGVRDGRGASSFIKSRSGRKRGPGHPHFRARDFTSVDHDLAVVAAGKRVIHVNGECNRCLRRQIDHGEGHLRIAIRHTRQRGDMIRTGDQFKRLKHLHALPLCGGIKDQSGCGPGQVDDDLHRTGRTGRNVQDLEPVFRRPFDKSDVDIGLRSTCCTHGPKKNRCAEHNHPRCCLMVT